MTTVFSRIIAGEQPGTFVWRDDRCVAFLSINPLAHGHVLVVPIEEIDEWIDAPADLVAHLFEVTRIIALAQRQAFGCQRVGVIIAGYEVPHTHVHVIPTNSMAELAFANAARSVDPRELESAARAIRAELRSMGRSEAAGDVLVSGSVTYRQRVALPPGAVVSVEVQDVSRADAAAVTIAEQTIEADHQVPIPFSIVVPTAELDPRHRYGVAARIEVDGRLAWISDTHHAVAVDGQTELEIIVVPAGATD